MPAEKFPHQNKIHAPQGSAVSFTPEATLIRKIHP